MLKDSNGQYLRPYDGVLAEESSRIKDTGGIGLSVLKDRKRSPGLIDKECVIQNYIRQVNHIEIPSVEIN